MLDFFLRDFSICVRFILIKDVNDHTTSSIIKLRYRIVSIAKRNENVQKSKILIERKIKRLKTKKIVLLIKYKRIFALV